MNRIEQLVICVDDDKNFLKSLEFFLPEKINREEGDRIKYRFLFFDNPLAALNNIKEFEEDGETVAMVISDQRMPGMGGIEFLAEIKKICRDSIRILITGYAGIESAIMAVNEKLLDKYLTKPIENEHDFVVNIRHLLQRFRMQKTIIEQDNIIHKLFNFANALNWIEDFEQTLSYIVSFMEEMLKCRQISIMLYEAGLLRIRASKGIPEDVVTSTRIPVGERISDRMFRSGKAILVKTLDEIPYLANAVNVEAGSFFSMPLLLVGLTSADRPLGLINVSRKKNDPAFTDCDLESLTYIADTASIAINNQEDRIRLQSAYVETMARAAALEYQATHDKLTGLPNRAMFKDRAQEAILAGKHEKRQFALLLMDLGRFKEINDTGHHNGDLLLQRIGQKLQEVLPETCVPARLGGDEFAVFVPGAGLRDATQAAQMILDALKDPVRLEGISLKINMSIGLSLYPDHGQEADLLFHRAEAAMYMAKGTGCGYSIYDPKSDRHNRRRLAMVGELRQAIEGSRLALHYQPKIDLKAGRLTGVEALVRWQHPKYGFIPPDQFYQLAEQTGLIKPLTFWALSEALRQCSRWHKEGLEIGMAVNLSPLNLQDENFPEQIAELLKNWGVEPGLLTLEITENSIMANRQPAMMILGRLNERGIRLSIDSFGTGHSSMVYIKQFPIQEIKIAGSFVMSLAGSANDAPMVKAAIELGHTLGLTVVAEGVESKEIYGRLSELDCHVGQGYFICPPLSEAELRPWIHESPWGLKASTNAPDDEVRSP